MGNNISRFFYKIYESRNWFYSCRTKQFLIFIFAFYNQI